MKAADEPGDAISQPGHSIRMSITRKIGVVRRHYRNLPRAGKSLAHPADHELRRAVHDVGTEGVERPSYIA
jgi:hypothetical protein